MKKNKDFFQNLLPTIVEIGNTASEAIMGVYSEDFSAKNKSDGSPLTEADLKSNQIILEGLYKITPEIQVISEETYVKSEKRNDEFWLIDPLDGTRGFINKDGNFSVNIAFISEGRSVFGFVQRPTDGKIWTSIDSAQSSPAFKKNYLRVLMSKNHQSENDKQFLSFLRDKGIYFGLVEKGSSLKFCALVEDDADIYLRFGPTSEWDIAAAAAVLQSSGGETINIDTGKELEYGKEDILNPPFIAYRNKHIRDELGEILEEYAKKLL